jgi:hypothetical protein
MKDIIDKFRRIATTLQKELTPSFGKQYDLCDDILKLLDSADDAIKKQKSRKAKKYIERAKKISDYIFDSLVEIRPT